MKTVRWFVVVLGAGILAACGNGDGLGLSSKTGASTDQPASAAPVTAVSPADTIPAQLYISEVAANYRAEQGAAWIEVFNNSAQSINLGSYQLRARGLNVESGSTTLEPLIFPLPNISVPAGGYFVLAGKVSKDLKNSDKSAYIKDAAKQYVPYWTDSAGFIELLNSTSGQTVDFVRFGIDKTAPVTATAWSGDNVAAFPAVANYSGSSSTDPLDNYDRSIVRITSAFTATHGKNDWTHVAFPTPGGPNDVPGNAVDSDNDGIPDSAKIVGGKFAGLDLYGMGARQGHRDLFIQIDYMNSDDAGVTPQSEALSKILPAFQAHNIYVHFDAGNIFSPAMDPAKFNLSGNISHSKTLSQCTQVPTSRTTTDSGCNSLYQYSSGAIDVRRKPIFRYILLANSQNSNGSAGASGVSELPGNKSMVTMGNWSFSRNGIQNTNVLINMQASTIMHELGHSLGLHHGGFEDTNLKPNYFSIMNYMYQLEGLPLDAAGTGPTQRYYFRLNNYGIGSSGILAVPDYQNAHGYGRCSEPDGPCDATFKIDYSDGSGHDMNELALDESQNIGRGANPGAFGDWNDDGLPNPKTYPLNVIGADADFTGAGTYQTLRDNNDWTTMILKSGRNLRAGNVAGTPGQSALEPTIVKEEDAPASLLNELSRMKQRGL